MPLVIAHSALSVPLALGMRAGRAPDRYREAASLLSGFGHFARRLRQTIQRDSEISRERASAATLRSGIRSERPFLLGYYPQLLEQRQDLCPEAHGILIIGQKTHEYPIHA